jgi:two-component system response regulator HydG
MPRKRSSTGQTVTKLRQAEVELSRGVRTPQVWQKLGVSEQTYYRIPKASLTPTPVLFGGSAPIVSLREDVACASRFGVGVLISGESGVGKEAVARLIHGGGTRAPEPLLAVNCAGLTDLYLESQLFGHVRGSFADADRDKRGLLEQADGGTLFIDEVEQMSLRMQALLLRFLETSEIQPVGSDRLQRIRVDVQLIAATKKDLVAHCAQKAFRLDLFYRLNVIHIVMAPLRARRDDIPLLLAHLLTHYAKVYGVTVPELSSEALAALVDHDWPGNIKELMNVAEQLTARQALAKRDSPRVRVPTENVARARRM